MTVRSTPWMPTKPTKPVEHLSFSFVLSDSESPFFRCITPTTTSATVAAANNDNNSNNSNNATTATTGNDRAKSKKKGAPNRQKRDDTDTANDPEVDGDGSEATAAPADQMSEQEKIERLQQLENKLVGGEEVHNEERKKKRKKKLHDMQEKQEQRKRFTTAVDADDDDAMVRVFDDVQDKVREQTEQSFPKKKRNAMPSFTPFFSVDFSCISLRNGSRTNGWRPSAWRMIMMIYSTNSNENVKSIWVLFVSKKNDWCSIERCSLKWVLWFPAVAITATLIVSSSKHVTTTIRTSMFYRTSRKKRFNFLKLETHWWAAMDEHQVPM